jgi:hypothetical protein
MGLQDGRAGADHFPPFAPHVARGTERTEAALGGRPVCGVRQGPLAGRLAGAIDVKDQLLAAHPIPQTARWLLVGQSARQEIERKRARKASTTG